MFSNTCFALSLALLSMLFAADALAQKRIAITIDDVPVQSSTPISVEEAAQINRTLLAVLQRRGVKAVGFVNENLLLVPGKIDPGVQILDDWLAAGMELGNHSFGHVGMWGTPLAQVQDAVVKGDVLTRWVSARRQSPVRYYRHPYTQTGKDEQERQTFEAFLAARGYTVAPFTIEHDDYIYACVYDKLALSARRELQAKVVSEYDEHLREAVGTFESMSAQLFGRQIPQVLLIHATRLTAATLERTLSTLSELGYEFVTLEEALRDEAYRTPAAASGRFGPSWIARWARHRGVRLSAYGQADPAGETAGLHKQLCNS